MPYFKSTPCCCFEDTMIDENNQNVWSLVKGFWINLTFKQKEWLFYLLVGLRNSMALKAEDDGVVLPISKFADLDVIMMAANVIMPDLVCIVNQATRDNMIDKSWQFEKIESVIDDHAQEIEKLDGSENISMILLQLITCIGEQVSKCIENHKEDDLDHEEEIAVSSELVRELWENSCDLQVQWTRGTFEVGTFIEF
jgi:hypothetical protein